jgi:hypothetical protein
MRKPQFPIVAIDESGNTGANLLSLEQPVFALASTSISIAEADKLLARIRTSQTRELKFSQLKKTPAGRRRILEFLQAPELTEAKVKATVFHKRFMITTKMVDLLVETAAHLDGVDLYKDGANIALSNVHFFCMPIFCGKDLTEGFLRCFLSMVRERTFGAVCRFYQAAEMLYASSRDARYTTMLSPLIYSQKVIRDVLANVSKNEMDPAIPALYEHCIFWGEQLGSKFDLLHDESNTVLQEKDFLEMFMSRGEEERVIGYDRRKQIFPLRVSEIRFARSVDDARLQVVDMIGSAVTYLMKGYFSPPSQKEFWEEISSGVVRNLIVGGLWPSNQVTPKELETEYTGGINAMNHIADFLRDNR